MQGVEHFVEEKKKIPNYQAYKDEIKITELERPKRMIGKNAFSMAFS